MLIDSHCHIDSPEFAKDLPEIFTSMDKAEVGGALTVCCSLSEYQRALDFANARDNVWCSVGVHPSTDNDDHEATVEELVAFTEPLKVVAIGECGLDYHYNEEPWDLQHQRFATHINAARQADLPVIVHSRDANEDTMDILRDNKADESGFVLHCFCGDRKMAKRALDMGGYISFSGIVTFKNSQEIQEVASKYVPLDRILVETDCPYLSPVPFRGKRNDPSKVFYVAQKIAELRSMPFKEIAGITTKNFFTLFKKAALS
ncbi:MAG: TatD family hydrolase [Burkholderiales bacterium]|nr:TatD family hydrolase [Burkholderiales bacterium]